MARTLKCYLKPVFAVSFFKSSAFARGYNIGGMCVRMHTRSVLSFENALRHSVYRVRRREERRKKKNRDLFYQYLSRV